MARREEERKVRIKARRERLMKAENESESDMGSGARGGVLDEYGELTSHHMVRGLAASYLACPLC